MKPDAFDLSPGDIPNSGRLHAEIVKAVSYVEVQADLRGYAPAQGQSLYSYLGEVRSYLSDNSLNETISAAVATAIVLSTSNTRLVVTFDQPLDATVVPATSAFAVSGAGSIVVSAVAVSGYELVLTLSGAVAADGRNLTYTAPGTNALRTIYGELAAGFTQAIDYQTVGA